MRTQIVLLSLAFSPILAHTQTSAAVTAPTVYNQGDPGIKRPTLVSSVDPDFSDEARALRISGSCQVSLVVDVSGVPQDVHIIQCTNAAFAKNSVNAVEQYRFNPGTKSDGTPVPVHLTVIINYRLDGAPPPKLGLTVQYRTPAGTTATEPDANGIYPYSKKTGAPAMKKFADKGFTDSPAARHGQVSCDVTLTIDTKGVPSNAELVQCTPKKLENTAINSLLRSRFKPAMLNGEPVPIRVTVSITYASDNF